MREVSIFSHIVTFPHKCNWKREITGKIRLFPIWDTQNLLVSLLVSFSSSMLKIKNLVYSQVLVSIFSSMTFKIKHQSGQVNILKKKLDWVESVEVCRKL
jgi:hypothetical protein